MIQEGLQEQPRVCVCPFGLIHLSVPITDDSNSYGAISSGPWVEQGAEGMIVDGVFRLISPSNQEAIEEAARAINRYSPSKLMETRVLLVELARDLFALYSEPRVDQSLPGSGPSSHRPAPR